MGDVPESATDAFQIFKPARNKTERDNIENTPIVNHIDKYSDYYNMDHYKRGIAVIFNHYEFDHPDLNKREGTFKDSTDLKAVLEDLRFSVTIYKDLKYGAIYEVINTLVNSDHSNADCLVVAVLSHGDTGKIHARDHTYPPDTLWKPFAGDKCTTLAGKPKIFFIQACRGDSTDGGTRMRSAFIQDDAAVSSTYTIPSMADILVMYSTYDGYYSWRSPITGSWFIQSLCSELKKYGKDKDLNTILTYVNRKMAIGYQSNVPGNNHFHKKKQIGTIVSTFTRLLYFHAPEK